MDQVPLLMFYMDTDSVTINVDPPVLLLYELWVELNLFQTRWTDFALAMDFE